MSRLPYPLEAQRRIGRHSALFLEILPNNLFDGQALHFLALSEIKTEIALEIGIVAEALEIGLCACLAGLIRDRNSQRGNGDVTAGLGRNQNIVATIDPC